MLYIIFTVVFVLAISIIHYKWKPLPWYIYIPISSVYVALVIYLQFPSVRLDEKIIRMAGRPDLNEEMTDAIAGVPSKVAKKYHDAVYAYNLGDYAKAGEFVKMAIKEYEKNAIDINLIDHIKEQHFELVGQIYLFACKTFTRLHENELAYEYAKKSIPYRNPIITH